MKTSEVNPEAVRAAFGIYLWADATDAERVEADVRDTTHAEMDRRIVVLQEAPRIALAVQGWAQDVVAAVRSIAAVGRGRDRYASPAFSAGYHKGYEDALAHVEHWLRGPA